MAEEGANSVPLGFALTSSMCLTSSSAISSVGRTARNYSSSHKGNSTLVWYPLTVYYF